MRRGMGKKGLEDKGEGDMIRWEGEENSEGKGVDEEREGEMMRGRGAV